MAEEGRRDQELMRVGVFQPHGGRRGEVYRGAGNIQINEIDVGPVRRQLDGNPPKCWEIRLSMESAREATKEGGGVTMTVRNILSGGGPDSITLWGRDLGIFGGDVPEAGGSAYGITKADN